MNTQRTFTLFTCHFGDDFWVRNLLDNVLLHGAGLVSEVVVINQNRDSPDESAALSQIPGVTRVLEIEPNAEQIDYLGYDHGHALDSALAISEVETSHIIVVDSDCFPLDSRWLDFDYDGMVAEVPGRPHLSHPCFMVFPSTARENVSFSEGLLPSDLYPQTFDTGRLVGRQLTGSGYSIDFLKPEPAFRGFRGFFYKNRTVYHHKHGSLHSHLSRFNEKIYRRKIVNQDFTLTWFDFVILAMGRMAGRLFR